MRSPKKEVVFSLKYSFEIIYSIKTNFLKIGYNLIIEKIHN